MNVREEDRQKNSCPSRGLGLAAAAIGVGVGAALYYFFSKRPENPDGEGSTTGWSCEPPHTFHSTLDEESDSDSYTTISENSTTDTSIEDAQEFYRNIQIFNVYNSDSEETDDNSDNNDSNYNDSDGEAENFVSEQSDSEFHDSVVNITSDSELMEESYNAEYYPLSNLNNTNAGSDSEMETEWDVTNTVDMPSDERRHNIYMVLGRMISPLRRRTGEDERIRMIRDQAFRERSWSLEECSICFDVILKDHQITTLPCTHRFHKACIAPWLQEQQTCPNCRKAAE